jgi:hypothetical protein
MIGLTADVAIVGSGFGGSLLAMLLQRIGLSAVLIDRARHPRFAIGESSTPTADLILLQLAREYDLPRIAPLAKYGTWQAVYPEVVCGIKRGFSYFHHQSGQPFATDSEHSTERRLDQRIEPAAKAPSRDLLHGESLRRQDARIHQPVPLVVRDQSHAKALVRQPSRQTSHRRGLPRAQKPANHDIPRATGLPGIVRLRCHCPCRPFVHVVSSLCCFARMRSMVLSSRSR